ncbi:MAG: glutamyl-tRNA reductase [Cardiobacteriaceae bacterium]|nr:glutamyl-tRNA reductase [Cardiobacteriaceae bacterium]
MLNPSQEPVKTIIAFGVNHHTADSAVREKCAFSPEETVVALADCVATTSITEVALLSTCNRSEIYAVGSNSATIANWFTTYKQLDPAIMAQMSFSYQDSEAIRHVYRVASGMDSLILGEPQILGQIKQAYHLGKKAGTIGGVLERLFQQSFAVAKQIRHSTAIGANNVSVAAAGVKLTHRFFDDHERRTALIVGAGETAQLVAKYLKDNEIKRLIVANRTLSHAQALAETYGGFAISLEQLPTQLHEADIIIGAARSDMPLIRRDHVKTSLKQRHNTLQVFIDLAIPRNFDPAIDSLNQAFLYGVDDLEQIIDDNLKIRQSAARQAETIILLYGDDFIGWLRSKPQQQIVRKMRENANIIREQLLQESYRRLAHGEDPAQLLEQLSKKLTNKLLHNPSELIHAIPPDHKDWLAIIADTFKTETP